LAVSPLVWSFHLADRLPLPMGAFLDASTGSHFPVFPFSAFVLAGTMTGALIGRQDPHVRRQRALRASGVLLGLGLALSLLLRGRVDFWGPSPGYALLRMGGLLLL